MALRWGLGIIPGSLWLAGGFFSLITFLWVINLAFFVLWIIGFIGAVQGEKRETPLLGGKAQTMFPSI